MDDSNSPDPNPFNEDRDAKDNLTLIKDNLTLIDDIDGDQYFGEVPVPSVKKVSPLVSGVLPQRFMLWAIAIATVPTCMVAGFAYQINYQSLRDAERRTQEIRAVALADRLNNFVLRQYEDTKKLSQGLTFTSRISANKKLSDRQKQLITNRLNQYKNTSKIISSVNIYNLQGNLILQSTSAALSPQKLNPTVWQKVIRFNSPFINQPVNQSVSANNQYLIQFVVPILNPKTQKIQAILTSQFPINAIPKSAAPANYVIKDLTTDSKGNLLLTAYYPQSASLGGISNDIENNLVVVPTPSLRGLPDLKWQVAVIGDEPAINDSYIRVLGICILVLVLAIALITYFATKHLSQRLIQVSNSINNIAEGRIENQLSDKGNDEISHLVANVNNTQSRVQSVLENQKRTINQLQRLISTGVGALQKVIHTNGEDSNSTDIEAIATHLQASLVKKQTEINLLQREQDRLHLQISQKQTEVTALHSQSLDRSNEMMSEVEKLKVELINSSDQYKVILQEIVDQTELSQQEIDQKHLHIQKLEAELAQLKMKMADLGSQLQNIADQMQLHPQSLSSETIAAKNTELISRQIMQLREAIAISAKKAKRLSESSQKISKIIDLIHEISIESNFLAVNAGIKANREHNRDFSNFSDQVGKVANMSVAAMKEMELLSGNIQSETREVMGNLELGTSQISAATKLITELQADLQNVEETITHKSKAEFDLFTSLNLSLKACLDTIAATTN